MAMLDALISKRLPAVRETPAFGLQIHLESGPGITVLFGPSGAGKTLLLDSLAGFVRPDEGRILLDGELYFDGAAAVHLPPEQRRCGYISQDHALFPHMTVRGNLQFAASLPRTRARRLHMRRRINELLESFSLTALADRRPAQLSGGEKQRAALARLLVMEPKLLLLDEPSRGLDLHLRQAFWSLLRGLSAQIPVPILLVSHDIEEVCELAGKLAMIEGGRLLQSGTLSEVTNSPATLEIAQLLGLHNIAPAEIRALDPAGNRSRLQVFGQEIEGPYFPGHLIGDTGYLCIRRAAITVGGNSSPLRLRVEATHPSPVGLRVTLENDFTVVTADSGAGRPQPGELLTLAIPAAAMTFTASR